MHLAHDYIHPTPGDGRCRVRLYLPDDPERDTSVVICTELPENPGKSITNAEEYIAAEVISGHGLSRATPIWIEHYPRSEAERQAGIKETFDLVVFDSYEVSEVLTGEPREWRRTIGAPEWKALDRSAVEMLVSGEV